MENNIFYHVATARFVFWSRTRGHTTLYGPASVRAVFALILPLPSHPDVRRGHVPGLDFTTLTLPSHPRLYGHISGLVFPILPLSGRFTSVQNANQILFEEIKKKVLRAVVSKLVTSAALMSLTGGQG